MDGVEGEGRRKGSDADGVDGREGNKEGYGELDGHGDGARVSEAMERAFRAGTARSGVGADTSGYAHAPASDVDVSETVSCVMKRRDGSPVRVDVVVYYLIPDTLDPYPYPYLVTVSLVLFMPMPISVPPFRDMSRPRRSSSRRAPRFP